MTTVWVIEWFAFWALLIGVVMLFEREYPFLLTEEMVDGGIDD